MIGGPGRTMTAGKELTAARQVEAPGAERVDVLAPRLRLAVTRLARRLRRHGTAEALTPTQAALLATIERSGPMSLGALAAAEHLRPPTITAAVDRLERQGLVRRRTDDRDRRCVTVTVTAAGRRVLARSRSRKDALLSAGLERLEPDERAVLAQAVAILERLLASTGHDIPGTSTPGTPDR